MPPTPTTDAPMSLVETLASLLDRAAPHVTFRALTLETNGDKPGASEVYAFRREIAEALARHERSVAVLTDGATIPVDWTGGALATPPAPEHPDHE